MIIEKSPKKLDVEFLLALALTLLLIALHVILLMSAGPLWRDEISSVGLATKPTFSVLWDMMVYDPFPLQFFLLLRGWSSLVGDSDFALRCLGFAIGVGCLAAFWISARLTGQRAPTFTLTLFAVSPTLIIWGDSLRAYGLGVFWITITFGCFARLIQHRSWTATTLAALAAILSVQAMFTNALQVFSIVIAACAVAVRRREWKSVFILLGIGLLAALSLIPYAGVLQAGQEWAASRKDIAPTLQEFHASLLTGGSIFWWLWTGIIVAAIVFALRAQRNFSVKTPNERSDGALFGLIAGGLGFLATLFFFRVLSWPTHVWYYLPCLAIIALSVDLVFASAISSMKGTIIRVVLALFTIAAAFPASSSSVQTRASNLDVIANVLRKEASPQDLIVLNPFTDGITFQRYFHGPVRAVTVPIVQDLTLHRWDEVLARTRDPHGIQAVIELIDQTLKSGNRVWLVSSFIFRVPPRRPRVPLPLQAADTRPVTFFQGTWSDMIAYELATRSMSIQQADLKLSQPVNAYENSQLFRVSGWKENP